LNIFKGRKSTKRPTDTADQKFLRELENEVFLQQLSSKICKVLMEKIRKELKSIETTGIRKAMKELPAKAHRLGVIFFTSNL
jgi:signal recognition particle GTPase